LLYAKLIDMESRLLENVYPIDDTPTKIIVGDTDFLAFVDNNIQKSDLRVFYDYEHGWYLVADAGDRIHIDMIKDAIDKTDLYDQDELPEDEYGYGYTYEKADYIHDNFGYSFYLSKDAEPDCEEPYDFTSKLNAHGKTVYLFAWTDVSDMGILHEAKEDRERFAKWVNSFVGDMDETDEVLRTFNKEKQRVEAQKRDVYWWMRNSTPEEFIEFLTSLTAKKTRSEIRADAKEGAELIYHSKNWKVYKINTLDAATIYGKGTRWCITGKEKEYFWNFYRNKHLGAPSEFYFFINSFGDKYAMLYCKSNGRFEIYTDSDNYTRVIPEAPKVEGLPDVAEPDSELINELAKAIKTDAKNIVKVYPSQEELYDNDNVEKYTVFLRNDDMIDLYRSLETNEFTPFEDYWDV